MTVTAKRTASGLGWSLHAPASADGRLWVTCLTSPRSPLSPSLQCCRSRSRSVAGGGVALHQVVATLQLPPIGLTLAAALRVGGGGESGGGRGRGLPGLQPVPGFDCQPRQGTANLFYSPNRKNNLSKEFLHLNFLKLLKCVLTIRSYCNLIFQIYYCKYCHPFTPKFLCLWLKCQERVHTCPHWSRVSV